MQRSRRSTASVTRPGSRTALVLGGFVPVGLAAGRYADWLDTQASLCPISKLTGASCPLCGGTRAVLYMLSGEPVEALERNSGAAVVLMITAVPVSYTHLTLPTKA